LTIDTLKEVLANEYVQTAITIILTIVLVFVFWFGLQLALNTRNPVSAVVSTSMLPTLNVGDLIVIQGVDPSELNAQYITGDIVVFEHPTRGEPIVHRAVKLEERSDGYWITTHGDNNRPSEEQFHESFLIGKVIAKIPYIGNITLFLQTLGDIYFYIVMIIIVITIILSFSLGSDSEEKSAEKHQTHEKRRLFGKLSAKTIYVLIQNLLITSFLLFNLWGTFTFWQPGADPSQDVTIRGMYSDLQYHAFDEDFKKYYNNISEAYLSQGFLTYEIDCLVGNAVRPGVPTFSWLQASVLALFILNIWTIIPFLKILRKTENKN